MLTEVLEGLLDMTPEMADGSDDFSADCTAPSDGGIHLNDLSDFPASPQSTRGHKANQLPSRPQLQLRYPLHPRARQDEDPYAPQALS